MRTSDGRLFDEGTRGVGGTKSVPFTSVGEENLSMDGSDRYHSESVLVHELGHSVMNCGFDDSQMRRVEEAFRVALASGCNSGLYMYSNMEEFWANGTQAWFDAIHRTDVNNGIITRAQLRFEHPGLASLMEEVYGDGDWRYTHTCPKPWT